MSLKPSAGPTLKLKPTIRYEPVTFNELGDWTTEKIQKLVDKINSFL